MRLLVYSVNAIWFDPLILLIICSILLLIGCGLGGDAEKSTTVVVTSKTSSRSSKKSGYRSSNVAPKPTDTASVKCIKNNGKSRSARFPKLIKKSHFKEPPHHSPTNIINTEKHYSKSSKPINLHTKTSESTINAHDSTNSYVRVEPCKTQDFLEDNMVSVIPAPDEDPAQM
ncbi:hypothetical protein BLOT_001286 [Blomia tropicalis]|nr:hypothetical protein BLOT_001286 [Blomia tropicalis]